MGKVHCFLVTREVVTADVTLSTRRNLARSLKCPEDMVKVYWEAKGEGVVPKVDIEFPTPLPPSDLNVDDPEAFQKWKDAVAEMPDIRTWLKAKGVDNPDALIVHHVRTMVLELHRRLEILKCPAA